MSDLLYTKGVLRLAAEASGAGRLPEPDGTFTEHNPTCADRSTVELRVDDGRITAMAHDTKACVLAQASASILGTALPGHTHADLVNLRAEIVRMLMDGTQPAEPFGPYSVLNEVARFPSRHKCVLLPLDAAIGAFEALQARKPGGQGSEG